MLVRTTKEEKFSKEAKEITKYIQQHNMQFAMRFTVHSYHAIRFFFHFSQHEQTATFHVQLCST